MACMYTLSAYIDLSSVVCLVRSRDEFDAVSLAFGLGARTPVRYVGFLAFFQDECTNCHLLDVRCHRTLPV